MADPAALSHPAQDLSLIIAPYYLFRDWGAEVVVASIADVALSPPRAMKTDEATGPFLERYVQDRAARELFSDSLRFDELFADDFAAAFCVGLSGSGENAGLMPVLQALLTAGRPVVLLHSAGFDSLVAPTPAHLLTGTSPVLDPLALALAILALLEADGPG
ncbi:hypothetical protein ACELLULO517_20725 [Acidisoma cellulosilytica]|uniref:Uncharacterized protein n=1 Tax=Acidisoma cellulosilyticum TaxID=2802395 RepID=A0A963Z528_9PROT|nr:hypothetical protein [Acidisoma cellulosilyticum]MCB8882681.1 hypothetical protein [Acidisoma cellulosilyticum]